MNVTQEQLIDYLTAKAVQCGIPHDPDNKQKAFHIIDNPYSLAEFDEALRSFAAFPAVLMEEGEGDFSDSASANYNDTKEFSLMVVDKQTNGELPRLIRSRCLEIIKKILVHIRNDSRAFAIVPGKHVNFRINDCVYTPIGPMDTVYYGYMITLRFICPFSF